MNTRTIFMGLAMTACAATACDRDGGTPVEGLELRAHGVAQVIAVDEGAYDLLDDEGRVIGAVDRDEQDGEVELEVELRGQHAGLRWSGDEAAAWCDDDTSHLQTCAPGLTVAATVAEYEGDDVPAFTPQSPDPGFRTACETIDAWVWGNDCGGCFDEALSDSQYIYYVGGSCNSGYTYTSCSHTFCDDTGGGKIQPAQPTLP